MTRSQASSWEASGPRKTRADTRATRRMARSWSPTPHHSAGFKAIVGWVFMTRRGGDCDDIPWSAAKGQTSLIVASDSSTRVSVKGPVLTRVLRQFLPLCPGIPSIFGWRRRIPIALFSFWLIRFRAITEFRPGGWKAPKPSRCV